MNQNEILPRCHKKLLSANAHHTHPAANLCQHARLLQEKSTVVHSERQQLFSHQFYTSDTKTITWLFVLLEVLVLHQLLPSVVIYGFAEQKLPRNHHGRAALRVPTHEQWHIAQPHRISFSRQPVGGPARRQLTPSSSGYYQILPNFVVAATFMLFTQSLLRRPSTVKRKALQCALFWSYKIKFVFLLILSFLKWKYLNVNTFPTVLLFWLKPVTLGGDSYRQL